VNPARGTSRIGESAGFGRFVRGMDRSLRLHFRGAFPRPLFLRNHRRSDGWQAAGRRAWDRTS